MPLDINKYYPVVTDIISFSNIPGLNLINEELTNGLGVLFDKLHYDRYRVFHSQDGSLTITEIDLILLGDSKIPLFGDFNIQLNPSLDGLSLFEPMTLPFRVKFNWPILAYISMVDELDISDIPGSLFKIAQEFFDISKEEMIEACIDVFFSETDILSVISAVNSSANNITISENASLEEVIDILDEHSSVVDVLLDTVLKFGDYSIEEAIERLKQVIISIRYDFNVDSLQYLLTPKFSISIDSIRPALQFPASVLHAVNDNDEPIYYSDPESESETGLPLGGSVVVDAGSLSYHSKTGFIFNPEGSIEFQRSLIANSGLIVEASGIYIDLNDYKNISQATADGRPNSFKGIYVEEGSITLPPFLEAQGDTSAEIFIKNFLAGSEGGISGVIGMRASGIEDAIDENLVSIAITDTSADNDASHPAGIIIDEVKKEIRVSGDIYDFISDEAEEPVVTDESDTTAKTFTFPYTKIVNGVAEEIDVYIRDASYRLFKFDFLSGTIQELSQEEYESNGLLKFKIGNAALHLDSFHVVFHHNSIIASNIMGRIHLSEDSPALNVNVDIADGFLITIDNGNNIVPQINRDQIKVLIQELHLGYQSELWKFGIKTEIKYTPTLPVLDRLIPTFIDINTLNFTEGQPVDFDLSIKWDNDLEIGGNDEGGLQATIPLNINIADVLFLNTLKMNFQSVPGGLDVTTKFIGAGFNLGFISAWADGMGFLAKIRESDTIPDDAGGITFGRTHVELEFIPPIGIGFLIAADAVEGAGFLYLDYENHKYYGYLYLKVAEKIEVTAIGILQKIPNSDKNSFLALVTMTLPKAIPVGFNFSLSAVGGLAAIHRTMDTDALRLSVKTGALDNILFPEIPEENPQQKINEIIADLEAVFPIEEGRHSFALMARFINTEVVTVDLALMLSLPSPIVLALASIIKVNIVEEGEEESPAADMLRLLCLFVIIADFGKKTLWMDAVMFDSKIAGISVFGDFAMRYSWGSEKYFLISAGGFHPQYQVSENLALSNMKRVSLVMVDDEDTKIYGELYTAVTSNTFQFGVKVDIDVTLGDFGVISYFSLDTLIKFNPFSLLVNVSIGVALQFKGKDIIGIYFDLEITGPKPWTFIGQGSVEILKISYPINLDLSIGQEENIILPTVDVMPLVVAELENNRSYFSVEETQNHNSVVYHNEQNEEEAIILEPQGKLKITQNIVPLDLLINKYGESPITATERYLITTIRAGEVSISELDSAEEYFAPNQYVKASDSEKLSAKSFELFESGKTLAGDQFGIVIPETNQARVLEYELVYKTNTTEEESIDQIVVVDNSVDRFLAGGAFGKSDGFKRALKKKKKKGIKMRIKKFEYGIAASKNVRLKNEALKGFSKHQARDIIKQMEVNGELTPGDYNASPVFEHRPYVPASHVAIGYADPETS